MGRILIPPVTQKVGSNFGSSSDSTFKVKMTIFFSRCTERKIELFWPKKLSHLSWVETKIFRLNWKKNYYIGNPMGNEQSSIIAKAVNKQNTSKLLLYKLGYILKWFWKWFYFQCDFDLDFQITTSKMIWILILNHLH